MTRKLSTNRGENDDMENKITTWKTSHGFCTITLYNDLKWEQSIQRFGPFGFYFFLNRFERRKKGTIQDQVNQDDGLSCQRPETRFRASSKWLGRINLRLGRVKNYEIGCVKCKVLMWLLMIASRIKYLEGYYW